GPLRSHIAPAHADRRTGSVPSLRSVRRNCRDPADPAGASPTPSRGSSHLRDRRPRATRGRERQSYRPESGIGARRDRARRGSARANDAAVSGGPERPVVVNRPPLAVAHGGAADFGPNKG